MTKPSVKIAGYEWADGARLQSGAASDANAVGNHLELLRRQNKGELTPDDVVKDAKPNNSPLHDFFEWDNGAAAHQHRLAQARGLIRSVVAIYTSATNPARRMKAFIHVPEPGAPHYRDTAQALGATKTRALVLQRAWREFQEFRRKYADLAEFAKIFEAADVVRKRIARR